MTICKNVKARFADKIDEMIDKSRKSNRCLVGLENLKARRTFKRERGGEPDYAWVKGGVLLSDVDAQGNRIPTVKEASVPFYISDVGADRLKDKCGGKYERRFSYMHEHRKFINVHVENCPLADFVEALK